MWEGVERASVDIVLDGRFPRPGTKAHIRHTLLAAGWSHEDCSPEAIASARARLADAKSESVSDLPIDNIMSTLRGGGLSPQVVDGDSRKSPGKAQTSWVSEFWTSLTRHPWWLTSAAQGRTSLVLSAPTVERAMAASAAFVYDVWRTLGAPPQHRMPTFRRLNLRSVSSGEAMGRFMSSYGAQTDVLVVHGGALDHESIYQTIGYLDGVRSEFPGLLVYEAVLYDVDPRQFFEISRRLGFPYVLMV